MKPVFYGSVGHDETETETETETGTDTDTDERMPSGPTTEPDDIIESLSPSQEQHWDEPESEVHRGVGAGSAPKPPPQ